MMSKWYQKIALPVAIVFALPIVTVFCCCNGEAAAEENPSVYRQDETQDHHDGHSHDHHADHQHSSKSSHDHNECSHPQIIADLAGKVVSFLASQNSGFKIPEKDFAAHQAIDISPKADMSPPSDAAPPGGLFTNTPLYLQISVLRI